MKDNKRIYDRLELLDLVNKQHTCITLKHCNRKIELHAKYLKNVKTGIKEALDRGLNKFDYSLNGILLDYQNLTVLVDKSSGRIVGRFGEFLVTVNAEFFVFDPKIGSLLEGVVNSKSNTHVGCLVHKRFNAMILKPDNEDNWNCENIQIGDKIIFTIVDHVFSSRIPHIEGVLATEYIKKSSKKSKKKSKIVSDQAQELQENGGFYGEQDVYIQGNEKTNKTDEVDSSNLSFKKEQEQEDLTDILGDKLQKSKSKKKKNVSIHNLMDKEEFLFEVKKKKKHAEKDKSKSDSILETEKNLDSVSASFMLEENPALVRDAKVTPSCEGESFQVKKKKKKRDKEKHLENIESSFQETNDRDLENLKSSAQTTKKKAKDNKVKDLESMESASQERKVSVSLMLEENPALVLDAEVTPSCEGESSQVKKKKKKRDKEKYLENAEDSVEKSKKKKKRDRECPPGQFLKAAEQCEISPSKSNNLLNDLNEINISSVDLIDQLMNVVPTDLISRSEVSPVKKTSLENPKCSEHLTLEERYQKGAHSMSQSPSKKKREESFSEIPLKITGAEYLVGSPSKKRRMEEPVTPSKSTRSHEKSLFSDSEMSAPSPVKPLRNPVVLDVGSSQWNLGVVSDKSESDKVPMIAPTGKTNNLIKKERKPKKTKDHSKKESGTVKEVTESSSSTAKSVYGKNEKGSKDTSRKSTAGNKTVTWNAEGMLSTVIEPKTTLLQRFEKSLGKDVTKPMDTPSSHEKIVSTTSLVEKESKMIEGVSKAKEKKPKAKSGGSMEKVKKAETKKEGDTSKENLTRPQLHSKIFELTEVDNSKLNSPIKTSTPKAATNSEDLTGKSKTTKRTKKPSENVNDEKRKSLINALLEQARESLGLDFLQDSPKTTKENVLPEHNKSNSTISCLIKNGSKKTAAKKTTKTSDNSDRLGSTDSGFNSTADKQKL